MNIQEYFKKLGLFGKGTLYVYDSRHAIEEFKNWFPNLDIKIYRDSLEKGVSKILKTYGLIENNYMIISRKHGFRIPLHIREDVKAEGFMIGVTPTTLAPHETKDLRKEISIYVESFGYSYKQFKLTEGFNYYTDKDKVISDFEEIIV